VQVEQIHLLKGGSIELLILRSVITFDAEKQHFLDPVDSEETSAMKLEQLEKAETGLGLFDDHMRFVRTLAVDLRADETTLILLLVISLFSPDRDNLEHKDLVAAEQERYSMLLRAYLESVHPLSAARVVYPRLLMTLTDIRNLNEEHSQVLLKVNPEGIQPLMKEVLDLSN
jgi:Ligand-binding domain of nuclear hormone receptor